MTDRINTALEQQESTDKLASVSQGLAGLAGKLVENTKHHAGAALMGLAFAVSGSAHAQTPPQVPSAPTESAKGGQVVQLADGKMVSVQDIANMSAGKEKDALINGLSDADYAKYDKYLDNKKLAANQTEKKIDTNIQAANQRISEKQGIEQAANQTEKKIDTALVQEKKGLEQDIKALNQQKMLHSLVKELIAKQGLSTGGESWYRERAQVVTSILENPLTRPEDSGRLLFLENIKAALQKGTNPFAYMSKKTAQKILKDFES